MPVIKMKAKLKINSMLVTGGTDKIRVDGKKFVNQRTGNVLYFGFKSCNKNDTQSNSLSSSLPIPACLRISSRVPFGKSSYEKEPRLVFWSWGLAIRFCGFEFGIGLIFYRLKEIDLDGSFSYSEAIEVLVEQPTSFTLYPNLFNPETIIRYELPGASQLFLSIFNTLVKLGNLIGQELRKLVEKELEAGIISKPGMGGIIKVLLWLVEFISIEYKQRVYRILLKKIQINSFCGEI